LDFFSKQWDLLKTLGFYFNPRDFTSNPGILLQTLGFYSKTWDFTPTPKICCNFGYVVTLDML